MSKSRDLCRKERCCFHAIAPAQSFHNSAGAIGLVLSFGWSALVRMHRGASMAGGTAAAAWSVTPIFVRSTASFTAGTATARSIFGYIANSKNQSDDDNSQDDKSRCVHSEPSPYKTNAFVQFLRSCGRMFQIRFGCACGAYKKINAKGNHQNSQCRKESKAGTIEQNGAKLIADKRKSIA